MTSDCYICWLPQSGVCFKRCKCTAYAHHHCIQTWINITQRHRCPTCHAVYRHPYRIPALLLCDVFVLAFVVTNFWAQCVFLVCSQYLFALYSVRIFWWRIVLCSLLYLSPQIWLLYAYTPLPVVALMHLTN